MRTMTKALVTLASSALLCGNALAGDRAEIIMDSDLYADSEVRSAIQAYANAVQSNQDIKITISSFPAAIRSNAEGHPYWYRNASQLKTTIVNSYNRNDADKLVGVLLIGNLPYAEMEYYAHSGDYHEAARKKLSNDTLWTFASDLYFMDMDGEWKDEFTADNHQDGKPYKNFRLGSNGVIDTHYSSDPNFFSTFGDDFEIWVSRVNPYGEYNLNDADEVEAFINFVTDYSTHKKKLSSLCKD